MRPHIKSKRLNALFNAAIIVVLAGLVLLLFGQKDAVAESLRAVQAAYVPYLLAAVMALVLSYLAAAAVYVSLSNRHLKWWPTFLVQVSTGLTNRVLPAGGGALISNGTYLQRQGLTKPQIIMMLVANNSIGLLASLAVIVMTAVFDHRAITIITNASSSGYAAIIVTIIILLLVMKRSRVMRTIRYAHRWLKKVGRRQLAGAFVASLAISVSYLGVLYLVMLSLNVHIGLATLSVIYFGGVLASSLSPTPGGIGGAEAALVALMALNGVSVHQAIAVAGVYRFITYWLPIAPGVIALKTVRQQGYI